MFDRVKSLMKDRKRSLEVLAICANALPRWGDHPIRAAARLAVGGLQIAQQLQAKDGTAISMFPELQLTACYNPAVVQLFFSGDFNRNWHLSYTPVSDWERYVLVRASPKAPVQLVFIEFTGQINSVSTSCFFTTPHFSYARFRESVWTRFGAALQVSRPLHPNPDRPSVELNFTGLDLSRKLSIEGLNLDQDFELEEVFESFSKEPKSRTALLAGPPGTGKTTGVLRGVIGRSYRLIQINGDVLDRVELADIAAFLKLLQPQVVLIDDFDSSNCGKRNDKVLAALEALRSGPQPCLTFITANRPEVFSAAMLRSGRIDQLLEYKLPSLQFRSAVFARLALEFSPNEVAGLAELTDGFNYADLQDVVDELLRGKPLAVTLERKRRLIQLAQRSEQTGNSAALVSTVTELKSVWNSK